MKLDFRPAQPEDIAPLFAFNRELDRKSVV